MIVPGGWESPHTALAGEALGTAVPATASDHVPTNRGPVKATHIVSAMVLSLAVAGCGASDVSGMSETPNGFSWEAPDRYEFTLDSSCGERWLLGRFRVRVQDGEVADVDGLDEQARGVVSDERGRESVETLRGLLDQAEAARQEGADVVEVEMSDGGHPRRIDIDWDEDAIDDEACYQLSDYSSRATS